MSNFNKIGGRYGFHSGSAKVKNMEVTDNLFFQGDNIAAAQGNVWYVNSAASVSGSGKTWSSPFSTIAEAVTAAGENGDIIYVAPGDYEISATIAIDKDNLKIIGPNKSCNDYSA